MSQFPVEYEERKNGKVAILSINGLEPNNTLNYEMLKGFTEALYQQESADAVIIKSSHPKFFSNGLDGAYLLGCDEKQRTETITEMIKIFRKLIEFPKPWVCEIAGYAMAGGAVIASAADYRYMSKSAGRIGFSELAVGLPLPMVYIHGLHRFVQSSSIRGLIEGAALKPEEALAAGLVDGVAESADKLHTMCLKKIDSILRLEQESYLPTRNLYRKTLVKQLQEAEPEDVKLASELIRKPVFEKALQNIAGKN